LKQVTDHVKSDLAARVRPAVFADAEAIKQLHERNGMGRLDTAAWRSCWDSYPFAREFADIPIGWVLETDIGEVVGTIGNVHMLYEMEGRRFKAAIATAWVVDALHRGNGLRLATTFFKQKGVDLFLNGSANQTASKVLAGLRIPRIPIPNYDIPCFWATSPISFAKGALSRRGTPGASILAYPAGFMLLVRDILRRSGRGTTSTTVRRLRTFDDRFDPLWQRISAGPPRLRAVRTRAVLDWKFSSELSTGRAAILAAESAGNLVGYLVLVRREGSGMELYDVADMQAAGDTHTVFYDLLLGATRLARKEGVDAVKLMTGTPAKRAPADALRPHTYRLPFWQLYYKASPELSSALHSAEAWDFSIFDTY
jgi:hypothetical protein